MLNQVILVGNVVSKDETTFSIVLRVMKQGNVNAYDHIRIFTKKEMFLSLKKYLNVGSTVGAKCRITSHDTTGNDFFLSVEKLTFINSKEESEEN